MIVDILRVLDEIEADCAAEITYEVRVVIEARGWLVRLGIPFNLEGLLRVILRKGFGENSSFRGLAVELTPRAAHTTLPPPRGGDPTEVSEEVIKCLHLAGTICRHFGQTQYIRRDQTIPSEKSRIGQDVIVFAIAHMAPGLIAVNLQPAETAQWIQKIARGVAKRSLSNRIGPSIMYDLQETQDVREFLNKRSLLKGWYLKALLARSLVVDGEKYVYLAASERTVPQSQLLDDSTEDAPGLHSSFCFIGVPEAMDCPDWGQLTPPIRIVKAFCEPGETGDVRFMLKLDRVAAEQANLPGVVTIEFKERLTVEEYKVAAKSQV